MIGRVVVVVVGGLGKYILLVVIGPVVDVVVEIVVIGIVVTGRVVDVVIGSDVDVVVVEGIVVSESVVDAMVAVDDGFEGVSESHDHV